MHGAMPRPARVQVHDVELGKKEDGKRPNEPSTPRWNAAVPRLRKRRWAAIILAMGFFYVFFKNMPQGLTPTARRADIRVPGRTINNQPIRGPPRAKPKPPQRPVDQASIPLRPIEPLRPAEPAEPAKKSGKNPKTPPPEGGDGRPARHYNGDVEFPALMATLQAESSMLRYGYASNVMFAASNLQAASILIPMVCEMSRLTENVVNFAYFGRDNLPMSKIQEINGAKEGCKAMWHDARPDQSTSSSDERFRRGVADAISHINGYVRPEAYLVVDAANEELSFVETMKTSIGISERVLIEIPSKDSDKLMWLTRLDAKSLSSLPLLDIKILIQVTKENVGGLFQLLKSIFTADYTGHRHPHISFEIPADLDIPSLGVVESFAWPPMKKGEPYRPKISIRKRISRRHASPLESATRTVEDFYPGQPIHEHIMVLSADVELSPMWYHYLIYNVLEYAYSTEGASQMERGLLAGISLITPLTKLDQKTAFDPPKWSAPTNWDPDLEPPKMESPETVPFMWQAPDTMATLYFGHKWKELHSFLSLRLDTVKKQVVRKIPQNIASFAEPLNELMELRGYYILYPNLPAHQIATYQPNLAVREEFISQNSEAEKTARGTDTDADLDPYSAAPYSLAEGRFSSPADMKALATYPIHTIIPNKGVLQSLRLLPILDAAGSSTTAHDLLQASKSKRDIFRISTGRCPSGFLPQAGLLTAEDMFCTDSGDSYSGSSIETVVRPPVDWQKIRQQNIDADNNALGDATPIAIKPGDKKKEKEVHDEFLEHLNRHDPAQHLDEVAKTAGKPKLLDPEAPDSSQHSDEAAKTAGKPKPLDPGLQSDKKDD